jgi:hypothetical protein
MIVAQDSTAREPETSEASEPDKSGESEKTGAN